jgi:hypothetical protein
MFSWDDPADRVAIAHMNAELQHAQLELLSAHCATHQLRLRYSAEDLARFGRRDILRKSFEAATAISQYYGAIEKKVPPSEAISGPPSKVTPEQIKIAEARVVEYLREQQNFYGHAAVPLTNRQRSLMWPYFSPAVLESVRIVELAGKTRVPTPAFYPEYRALGFANLPEVTHMPSLTFLDVVVFNEHVTERSLFHGLVHVVQFEVLGLERYAELFVRSFVTTKLHFTVPLEAHAFSLESKFVAAPASRFSVEEQVRLWVKQERY